MEPDIYISYLKMLIFFSLLKITALGQLGLFQIEQLPEQFFLEIILPM